MVYFVGAGPGAPDLITLRGAKLLAGADCVIYAGSLVNRALLDGTKEGCRIFNSAEMTLEEVLERMRETEESGGTTVRLHTGDPSLYGAIREQMTALDAAGIRYEICPGVSSFCAAAAALQMEYTLPGITQMVVITRAAGRTPVPEKEELRSLAGHGATMVLFLSAGLAGKAADDLMAGGLAPDTPAAVVQRVSWPDEAVLLCTLGTLADAMEKAGIRKTALIIVGEAVSQTGFDRSCLYDPSFTTEYRKGKNV